MYTVESVTSGHPDKVCDQISDAILDACLEQDPSSRVAIETFGCHGLLVVGGELTTKANIDVEKIARNVYRDIGYFEELEIITRIEKQSPDIAQGVDAQGAGDQGIMYGFATNETSEYLPEGLVLVHKLTKGLEDLRKKGEINWLKPDGKAQVTFNNSQLETILVSCQHDENITQEKIINDLKTKLIKPLINAADNVNILVNPTGKFHIGGFAADTGLTGRKIMVDTYGGIIPHGGGCFSGKDATKVDRSAAYMARYAAKNLVANELAQKCLVAVSYAIGRAEPLMIEAINEKGENLISKIKNKFDFRPKAIIERLDLRTPIFQQTASYGHFGRPGLPWENTIEL
ncbi:methionine adenosyltransferase [Patescibacteria group bacterium]